VQTEDAMGAITIRNLDDALIKAIERSAADKGRSMEDEVRRLLETFYANATDASQEQGKAWTRRQLERLKRGELPMSGGDSAELIRAMREERDAQVAALRAQLTASIEQGGYVTDEQIDKALAAKSASLVKDGY
jgi:plasmid stability protein